MFPLSFTNTGLINTEGRLITSDNPNDTKARTCLGGPGAGGQGLGGASDAWNELSGRHGRATVSYPGIAGQGIATTGCFGSLTTGLIKLLETRDHNANNFITIQWRLGFK